MKQIPTSDPSLSMTPDAQRGEASRRAADEDGWLIDLLQRQARLDAPADQDFSAAVMQMLPPRSDRVSGAAAASRQLAPRRNSIIPGWLAAALPWLGLYGLVVTAATLLWLALTLAVMPGAVAPATPSLLGSGALEAWEELANSLGMALAHWLAPTLILGWLAWWLHQQELLME